MSRTNPIPYQMCDDIWFVKSSDPALKPVTPTTSADVSPEVTSGTTVERSSFTASSDYASVPLPASGTFTSATVRSGLRS